MPSAIVHLKAAYDLADKLNVKNYEQFYVGAVSPDAVNIDGFASQEVRYPAHLRSLDYEEWKQNTRSFCIDNKDKFIQNEDFLKGYLLHIFTDIYWDELAQPILFAGLTARGAKPEELRDLKWKELYKFNLYLTGDWLYKEVFPLIKEAELSPIGTISKDQLTRYINDLTGDYQTRAMINEPPEICNISMVEQVEAACVEEFKNLY